MKKLAIALLVFCLMAYPAKAESLTPETPIVTERPEPLSDTDTALLWWLWQGSLGLAAVSVAIALSLVARRQIEDMRNRKRAKRRKQLEDIIWGVLLTPPQEQKGFPPPLQRGDAAILCDFALNILRPLRGEEADRIVRLLVAWGIEAPLHSILAHGSRGQRIRMLTLLSHFNDRESAKWLMQHISHPDLYIQLAALNSLAIRGAVEALPEILKQLARADRHNTPMLADVLERFGEPAIGVLVPLAGDASQLDVRLAAIAALGALGSLETVPALITLASDPVGDIRAQAIAALGRIGDGRAEDAVLKALSDKEDSVRLQAAQAASKLQMEGAAVSALLKLLSDSFWWVRYRAAEALYRMGDAGPMLLRSASLEDSRSGHIAGQVLAELESGSAHV